MRQHGKFRKNIVAALFSIILVAPITLMLFDRDLPVILAYTITTAATTSGQSITIKWNVKVNRVCEGVYMRRIVDSGGFITNSKSTPLNLADKITGETFVLPLMLPGSATYQVFTTYWCNPLQKYIWPIMNTEKAVHFNILESMAQRGLPGPQGPEGPRSHQGDTGVAGQSR